MNRKIAIMQPYWWPYIGYFQLLFHSDTFVIYNDVAYIERGWSNRNNFLINKSAKMLTLPLKKASSSKLYNEIYVNSDVKLLSKLNRTIEQSYSKAPFFNNVYGLIEESTTLAIGLTIDQVCYQLLQNVINYLDLEVQVVYSSDLNYNKELDRVGKINSIAGIFDSGEILFPPGSMKLYQEDDFKQYDTRVVFPNLSKYDQQQKEFIPALSFLDVLMFNSVDEVIDLLSNIEKKPLSNVV